MQFPLLDPNDLLIRSWQIRQIIWNKYRWSRQIIWCTSSWWPSDLISQSVHGGDWWSGVRRRGKNLSDNLWGVNCLVITANDPLCTDLISSNCSPLSVEKVAPLPSRAFWFNQSWFATYICYIINALHLCLCLYMESCWLYFIKVRSEKVHTEYYY